MGRTFHTYGLANRSAGESVHESQTSTGTADKKTITKAAGAPRCQISPSAQMR